MNNEAVSSAKFDDDTTSSVKPGDDTTSSVKSDGETSVKSGDEIASSVTPGPSTVLNTAMIDNTTGVDIKESNLINSAHDTVTTINTVLNNYNIGDVISLIQLLAPHLASTSKNQSTGSASSGPLPQAEETDHTTQSEGNRVDVCDMVPSNPSAFPVATIADRYTRSMLECLVGYPLYEPEPFSQYSTKDLCDGVNVGDVGFVRDDGAFDFLFNICPPQNDSINPSNLPNGFSLETSEDSETRQIRPLLPETCLFSRTVTKMESGEYMCKGSEGAVLVLPEGAIQYDAINRGLFEELAKRHGVEWYKYTKSRGRSISNGSLYLVTSFTKCSQWGIAVFDRPCDTGQGLKFNRKSYFPFPFLQSSPKYHWKGSGAIATKVADPKQNDAPNQCVFLRGFKIMIRKDIFDELSSLPRAGSSGGPSMQRVQADRMRGGASGGGTDLMSILTRTRTKTPTVTQSDAVVLQTNFNSSPIHPSDLINTALLSQNPGAKVALTHDDVWCDLLRDNIPKLNTARLANIALTVTRSYMSTVDEYGCVSLEKTSDRGNVPHESNYALLGIEAPSMAGSGLPDIFMHSDGGHRRAEHFGGVPAHESGRNLVLATDTQTGGPSDSADPVTVAESTNTPRQMPAPQRQPPSLPAQPGHSVPWDVAQQPQQSDFQAPPAPVYDPPWMVSQPPLPPPPEQSAFHTNDDYGSQWRGQHQDQQLQHYVPPPTAQPLSQRVAELDYTRHYFPQPVASPQHQLSLHPHPCLQPQQQQQPQHLRRTPPPQDLRLAKRQRSDGPNLNKKGHQHAPLPPQPQFQPFPFLVQNAGVYPDQNHSPGGYGSGKLKNLAQSVRGATAGKSRDGSLSGGGRQGAQSDDSIRAPGSGGNFEVARQAGNHYQFSNIVEPAAVSATTLFQGAHNVRITGNPHFTNITGNLTTVNNSGGTHGLENLKEFVSFEALFSSAGQDPDRCCHPATQKNVLTRLRDWFDNPNSTDGIFWLHGPAGAGKSAIAQTIARTYKREEVAATFFFFRSDPTRNDANRLFTTIAWQLAFSIPAIKDFIEEALDKLPHLPRTDVETQFEELVVNPTKNIASKMVQPAPIVIIDGVDECSDEKLQRKFLAVIGNAIKNHRIPLRFLIVSRPEAQIEETLDKFKDFTVSIDLAKLDDANRDIETYLIYGFSRIASERGLESTWPDQEIVEETVFKSSGQFVFASTVMKYIGDEDCDPEDQLDIVLNLKLHGRMSPFAFLDRLFLEILKRQQDQNFLKTFLALLVGHTSISIELDDLCEDDVILMNVAENDLRMKLRGVRSLLNFEPFIQVHHKSFLDFLQDPYRSGQYHVSKEEGQKQYLKLIVNSVVRHVSMAIEQPNRHETCRFSPKFKSVVVDYPPKIVLPVKDWQEALNPLLYLQDKLLNLPKLPPCRVIQVMRDLLLHLMILQRGSRHIATTRMPGSNMNEPVTGRFSVPVTVPTQNIPETNLDSCLSALLSCLQETNSIMVDGAIIDHMSSLLAFDYAETAAKVRSIADAQKVVDLIDLLNNNKSFLRRWGPDAARKAAHLASKVYARVPILPLSTFLNGPGRHVEYLGNIMEFIGQNVLISKILDHNYILPLLRAYDESDSFFGDYDNIDEQNVRIDGWLEGSSPSFSTRIRVMLEIARSIRYIHSMNIALYSEDITSHFFLDSSLRAKFMFRGLFGWWSREASIYGHEDRYFLAECTYESNITAFAVLFSSVCFGGLKQDLSSPLVEDARRFIERCRTKDLESMEDVVKEMETWDLT